MFQKSLQILVASALLALAATVGYSFLRLHGPEDTLAEARARLAAGAYGEVIADLDLAERGASFARSPVLLRELWRLRLLASADVRTDPAMEDCYVCSLHTGTVVYKGQLTPEQVWGDFLDLQQPDYMSHLALVHSRFSTNTFPSCRPSSLES